MKRINLKAILAGLVFVVWMAHAHVSANVGGATISMSVLLLVAVLVCLAGILGLVLIARNLTAPALQARTATAARYPARHAASGRTRP